MNYYYLVDRINPKGKKQKVNIIINAEVNMETLFIQTREQLNELGYILKTLEARANLVISRNYV